MNRYLIRALVAVLTFCIGVAVGMRPRPFTYHYKEYRCGKRVLTYNNYDQVYSLPAPVMSIENQQSDPLKIRYSFTKVNPADPQKRLVEFVVENTSGREISSYSIGYSSKWGKHMFSDVSDAAALNSKGFIPFVTINCDASQMLTVWLNSVEFSDGTTWINPLHSH